MLDLPIGGVLNGDWNPNIPAAILFLLMIIAMYAREIGENLFDRRFFSPERKRLQRIGRALQERAHQHAFFPRRSDQVGRDGADKFMPVDAEPSEDGNVELIEEGRIRRAIVHTQPLLAPIPLHKPHWATCPSASEHRK